MWYISALDKSIRNPKSGKTLPMIVDEILRDLNLPVFVPRRDSGLAALPMLIE